MCSSFCSRSVSFLLCFLFSSVNFDRNGARPVTIYRLKYWFRDRWDQTTIKAHSQLPVGNAIHSAAMLLHLTAHTNSSMAYHKQLHSFWLLPLFMRRFSFYVHFTLFFWSLHLWEPWHKMNLTISISISFSSPSMWLWPVSKHFTTWFEIRFFIKSFYGIRQFVVRNSANLFDWRKY